MAHPSGSRAHRRPVETRRAAPARRAKRPPDNAQVARALRELALFLELDGSPSQASAYESAARAVESLARPLIEIEAESGLRGVGARPAVGRKAAARIAEILRTGRIRELDRLRRATPIDVVGLTAIEGLGVKTARALYEELGVADVRALETACRTGRVRELAGFGAKREQRILAGIAALAGAGRRPLGEALPLARAIADALRAAPGVSQVSIAGSVRRRCDTVGDLDFVVAARGRARVAKAFAAIPEVSRVRARGEGKWTARLRDGGDADLCAVPEASFGAALLCHTGSAAHHLALRRIALRKRLELDEYGLFRGCRAIAGRTEADVYEALALTYVPPELRENTGEIEAARAGELPALIEHGDLRGDLRTYAGRTDGAAEPEALARMVEAARRLGLEYLAIAMRARDGGARNDVRVRRHAEAVRAEADRTGFRLLAGVEVDIRADGSLALSDETLARLDVVGAAIHGGFDQPRAEMTRRIVRAIEHPNVHLLVHPTARRLGGRPPVALDFDAVIAAAKHTATVLEIDARPDRLDLRDEDVRHALDAGVRIAIDSGASEPEQLAYANDLGIGVARRGGARRGDVLNALPLHQCIAQLKGGWAAGREAAR